MDGKRPATQADEDDISTERSKKLLKFSSTQNCNNVFSTDNRVDNRIDNSVTISSTTIENQTVYQQNEKVQEERVYKLLQMLSPLEPLKRHQDIRSTRLANTGSWLLELPRFQAWLDGMSKESTGQGHILCCYGMPGAGKTILSSLVIDHVLSHVQNPSPQSKIGIACLYSDYRDQGNQTLRHITGSLLQQLLLPIGMLCIPQALDIVINTLDDIQKRHMNVETKDILNMLKLAVQQLDCTYICIDALDELNQGTRIQLLNVLKDGLGGVRLFLTGRYNIQADLSITLNIQLGDHINIKANPDDIRAYLISQIEQDTNPDAMNEQLQGEILTTIPARSQGMFLLPALHIAAVLVPPTIAKRRKALKDLPPDLEAIFAIMVQRIQQSPSYAELGMQVLRWLHLAFRPLKLTELSQALAVKEEDIELDGDDIPTRTTILASCIGLIIVDDETSTVRFVHYTLEEFFQKNSSYYFPDGFSYAAKVCLRYLNFDKVRVHCSTRRELEQKQVEFAFLKYAACHWGHYVKEQNSDSVTALALRLISESTKCHCAMQVLYHEQRWYCYSGVALQFSAIHAAAYFGIDEVINQLHMPTTGRVWDFQDDSGRTPLSFAAENAHESMVRLLIDQKDVMADFKDNNGRTPLSWAVEKGHENIVRLLINRKDVVADSKNRNGQTPLSWAARSGHENIVQLLVDREDVVADFKNQNGQTPLSWAAKNGHENIVQLLVDREDVVADSKNWNGQTPLLWAARSGYENIVKLLVKRKDVVADAKDKDGRTPLSWAAGYGYDNIVRLLIGREDVVADSKDNDSRTPLSWAAEYGHENVVQLLVGREDVVTDSKDNDSRTPLSWAVENRHEAIIWLLVDQKDVVANFEVKNDQMLLSWAAGNGHKDIVQPLIDREDMLADPKDNYGRTPLSWAAGNGHEDIVQLLVDQEDVVVDSKDNGGRTPLSWAAGSGHEDVVQLLVDGEDVVVDSKDNGGRTPLSWAAGSGHKGVVQLLVDREDVAADSKDNNGRTPLSWAAANRHEDMQLVQDTKYIYGRRQPPWLSWTRHERTVLLLVDWEDVVADSKDNDGRTPLSWAAGSGHIKILRRLIYQENVVADSKDNDGRTALSWAAGNGQKDIVQLLVDEEDVVADSKDNDGRTALSWAAGNGHEDIVQLLVGQKDVVADCKDNDGQTPLSWAARNGHKNIVRLLVDREDVVADSEDNNGQIPLSLAAM